MEVDVIVSPESLFYVFRRTIHSLRFAQIRIFVYCIPCNDFLCLGKGCFPHLLSMFPSDALSDSVHSVSLTCVWDKKKKEKKRGGQLFCCLGGMKDFFTLARLCYSRDGAEQAA